MDERKNVVLLRESHGKRTVISMPGIEERDISYFYPGDARLLPRVIFVNLHVLLHLRPWDIIVYDTRDHDDGIALPISREMKS